MNKLLCAGFSRILKNKLFWTLTGLFAALGAFIRVYAYIGGKKSNPDMTLDIAFFVVALFIGIAAAIFCALFVGTEHSDGAIRNKLIVGHTKTAVYFSNLIVCSAASIIFYAAYFIVSFAVGIPLFGFLTAGALSIFKSFVCCIALSTAYNSIFVLVALLNQNKAASAVISILMAFILLFISSYINSSLNEPEYYDAYEYTLNGVTYSEDVQVNSNYLSGTKRDVYEFFFDFLPGCQSMRIAGVYDDLQIQWTFALYSLFITFVTTAAGVIIFKNKDIK